MLHFALIKNGFKAAHLEITPRAFHCKHLAIFKVTVLLNEPKNVHLIYLLYTSYLVPKTVW